MLPLALLTACVAAPADDDGLVTWAGYVYTAPQADVVYSVSEADGAQLTFLVDGDEEPVPATEPYADYPGYWSVALPPSVPVTVRVETDPPAVWRFTTPAADANWFSGALFGADDASLDELLLAFGVEARGPGAVVIGTPWDDGWTCEAVRVDGSVPDCFSVDESGVVSPVATGAFSYFLATGLDAGDVRVESGLGGDEVYPLSSGEVGMAFWFVGS